MVSVHRHVAQLRGALRPGEEERLWVRAERVPQGEAGALLLTDRRLLFCGMAFVQQEELAWPLAAVRDVVLRPGRPAALTCTALESAERFSGREADLRRLADALGEQAEAVPEDVAAGLERLAALHASGALTDREFAAAKTRLLS